MHIMKCSSIECTHHKTSHAGSHNVDLMFLERMQEKNEHENILLTHIDYATT